MWSPLNHAIYRGTMSQIRFKALTKYIRFDSAHTRAERIQLDKAAPITEIWTMLNANLQRAYTPSESITVDEQLYPFRGRTRFTQYMASKPAKYGIKVWWVCDSNTFYPLKGQIYTGKLPNQARETNQGERVVMDLVGEYMNCGRTVYTDNFFTSLSLAEHLLTLKTALVGTIRQNKRCLPLEMRFERHNPHKLPEFATLFAYHNNDYALCSYAPKPKKVVSMLSTAHYQSIVQPDGKCKPLQILDYNKHKCGVDTMDQMVGGYSCKRTTNRWPLAMFYNMLDTTGLASFIIYDAISPSEKTDKRRAFIINLCSQLVVPHMEDRAMNPLVTRFPDIKNAMAIYGVNVSVYT